MFENAINLIEKRLYDEWPNDRVQYDNVEYLPVVGSSFVRLNIEWVDTNITSVGGRAKAEGYIQVSVFTPSNTSSVLANQLADDIGGIFNRWQSGALKFKVARTVRVGTFEEWYQLNVLVPFNYDECISIQ